MGPQRTYSIRPLSDAAFGAIIIFPPVNLLLLNVRKRQRSLSNSTSASTRRGKARRRKTHQAAEHRENVAGFAEPLETAIGERGNVRRESHAQQIDVVEHAVA